MRLLDSVVFPFPVGNRGVGSSALPVVFRWGSPRMVVSEVG